MRTKLRTSTVALYLVIALAFCLSLSAQERFADINGTVKDATGAVVPNVKVIIENSATKRAYETQTGSDGNYNAQNLEPGKYDVKFERQGFSTRNAEGLNLLVGRSVKLDMTLQVGNTAESVTVTETAGLIDFTQTKIATNVTAEEFDRLPKGRSFQTLALTSTSVNGGHGNDIDGGLQVNGASGAENQFNIDGVSVTSLINGQFRQGALYEILSEVQVKTSGIDAEYGGAMGGVISAITKAGGNAFHGDAHYYYNGNGLNSAPVQRLVLDPSNEKTVSFVQDGKFKDNNNELGGSIGGPIKKDKLFFFMAFSPRFRHQTQDTLLSSQNPDSFTRNQSYHTWFNKLSYDITPKLRANFTYLWTPTRSTGRFPLLDGTCPDCSSQTVAGAAPNKAIGYSQPQSNYTGQVDWTPTATSLITFRGGRFWDDYKSTGITSTGAVEYATSGTGTFPFTLPDALKQPTNFSNTPRVTNTDHDLATRTYFQIDGGKIVNAWGQHNFKVGWGVTKTVNNVKDSYPGGGYVRIFWNGTEPLGKGGRGTYGYYEVNQRGTVGTTGGRMQNIYFQDTWQIKRRLTVSLGVRLENEHVPSFRREIRDDAFAFGFGDKTAPRVGVSYDLFGNGKARIYASYGRNFDWIKYELSRGSFGGDTWCIYYRSLETTDIFSGLGLNKPGNNLWSDNPANPCRDRRVPNFNQVAPGLKPFTADLYTGGFETQLRGGVLRVGYVHNQVIRAIEDLGVLQDGNEAYIYANPGEGTATTLTGTTGLTKAFPYPKPDRRYDGMEASWTRRFSKGYFLNASYTLSRLYGNYSGTQSTDEITLPTTGVGSATAQQQGGSYYRQGTAASRYWDLDEILFDAHGHLDVTGRLPTDRPNVFKLYGSKELKWNAVNATNVGLFFLAQSGTPVSTYVATTNQIPVIVEGRGDLGRTPVFSQTDLQIAHTFKIGETMKLGLEMNMINLFNQKTTTYFFNYLNRGAGAAQPGSAIDLSKTDLFKGYDYKALIAATSDAKNGRGALDPRYGQNALFNPGFAGRFGIRFTF